MVNYRDCHVVLSLCVLLVFGGCGGSSSSDNTDTGPVLSFSASQTSITAGESSILSWSSADASHRVTRDSPSDWGNKLPPTPALTWGDAPWAPGNEVWNGVLRGIQIYSSLLSVNDILAEVSAPLSTTAGVNNIGTSTPTPQPATFLTRMAMGIIQYG